jgi:hypothetical protein
MARGAGFSDGLQPVRPLSRETAGPAWRATKGDEDAGFAGMSNQQLGPRLQGSGCPQAPPAPERGDLRRNDCLRFHRINHLRFSREASRVTEAAA